MIEEESLLPQDLVPPFETREEAMAQRHSGRSIATLNGSHPLTVQQIQALATRFNIAPGLFL